MANLNVEANTKPQSVSQFDLDFGTKPMGDDFERITVVIDPTLMLGDFAEAYCKRCQELNVAKFSVMDLSVTELDIYFKALIAIRVQAINGGSPVWRQAKQLVIPSWIQFALTQIGRVIVHSKGLEFIPKFEYDFDINALLKTSQKLEAFVVDGLHVHKDAMPRSIEGDIDTMTMAVINNYVKSMSDNTHPVFSYVAAFLGMTLEKEQAFKMMYRTRYDDVEFIRSMIMSERSLT